MFSCSPIESIRAEGGTVELDGEAIAASGLIDNFDDPRLAQEMLLTLADVPRSEELKTKVDAMIGHDEDAFEVGAHFIPKPHMEGAPDRTEEALSVLLHASSDPDCKTPFGYATLKSSFSAPEGEEGDPHASNWHLHLHPAAVFVDARHRRLGYGLWLGEAMFVAAELALFKLAKDGAMASAAPRIGIDVYFEIYAEGGEKAVQVFNAGMQSLADILPEVGQEDSSYAIEISELTFDGGW